MVATMKRWIAVLGAVAALVLGAGRLAPAQPAPDAPDRSSARATMRSFLEAVNDAASGEDERLDDAAACLDLGTLAADVPRAKGRQLAADLKEIIDRTRYVQLDEIPDDPDGPPWVFLRERAGEVVIARATDGDLWLFTSGTVASIPALLESALRRDRVEGVPEAPREVSPAAWLRSRIPDVLRRDTFLLETWQWLGLLALILLGVIVDRLVVLFVASAARGPFLRWIPLGDQEILPGAVRPAGILAMAAVWWAGLLWLGLPVRILAILMVAVKFVIAAAAVWAAYRLTDVVGEYFAARARATETKFDDLLVPLIRKSVKIFIVAFGLVFIADNLNVDISSLLAGLGIGGLAFALAAQDTVKNLFGSLTVLLDKPFHVGDWVVIGDLEGTVEEVGFRSTRVRTFYNSVITLPNANLISTAVDNLGARRYRRWKTMLSLTYDTPPERMEAFCEGVRELIRRHPHTRKDYFHVYANEYAAASLNVLLYVFFETPDWAAELRERHRLFLDILRLAKEVGVEFAFPTQTLHVYSHAADEGDGGATAMSVEAALEAGRRAAKGIVAPPADLG